MEEEVAGKFIEFPTFEEFNKKEISHDPRKKYGYCPTDKLVHYLKILENGSDDYIDDNFMLYKKLYHEIENQNIDIWIKLVKAERLLVTYCAYPERLPYIRSKVGEWDREPDELRFTDKETGYECLIKRGGWGQLNGYVVIPESHPHYGNRALTDQGSNEHYTIMVHGGITFSGYDNKFLIGFDCAHGELYDFRPYTDRFTENYTIDEAHIDIETGIEYKYVYRNIEFVKKELKKLARQLKNIEENKKC